MCDRCRELAARLAVQEGELVHAASLSEQRLAGALRRSAADANRLAVLLLRATGAGGTVPGIVAAWAEHDDAAREAEAALATVARREGCEPPG